MDGSEQPKAGGAGTRTTGWGAKMEQARSYEQHLSLLRMAGSAAGKVIAITGCTSGAGLVAAQAAAQLGARGVLLLNRPSQRAIEAEAAVRALAPAGCVVRTVLCDLTRLSSVRAAAAELRSILGGEPEEGDGDASGGLLGVGSLAGLGLDVLACTAAKAPQTEAITGDGFDVQMQINHLGHFVLVGECMPLLHQAAALRGSARVVLVTSILRFWPPHPLDARYFEQLVSCKQLGGDGAAPLLAGAMWRRQQQSRLATAVFADALAELLTGENSPVFAVSADVPIGAHRKLFKKFDAELRDRQNICCCMGGLISSLKEWAAGKKTQTQNEGALLVVLGCFDARVGPGTHVRRRRHTLGMPVIGRDGKEGGFLRWLAGGSDAKSASERALMWAATEGAVGQFGAYPLHGSSRSPAADSEQQQQQAEGVDGVGPRRSTNNSETGYVPRIRRMSLKNAVSQGLASARTSLTTAGFTSSSTTLGNLPSNAGGRVSISRLIPATRTSASSPGSMLN
mmetsp:Transcript_14289/g.36302  ORF Transcript_14289/g.36302 Transcript_14289/m.36302 type:complete len:511 (+) Transcript_14289:2-1534(+)